MTSIVETIRLWIIANLPEGDAEIVTALNNKDAHDLLVTYHNWTSRLVQPMPRRIEKSQAFEASSHRAAFANALSAIERDIRKGNVLTKYLSKGVRVALKLPGKRKGASDLDMLYNDWGIHHLHLSTELGGDGFVTRTGPLLFVRFTSDAAYFLDIADHGEWTKETVADALVNEFPEAGGINVLKGVIGGSRQISDEEHQKLRTAGVNTVRMVGNNAVVGGGYNVHGRTIQAVMDADRLLERVEEFEKQWAQDEEGIRAQIQQHGAALPDEPEFAFEIDENGPLIVETKSRTALRIF